MRWLRKIVAAASLILIPSLCVRGILHAQSTNWDDWWKDQSGAFQYQLFGVTKVSIGPWSPIALSKLQVVADPSTDNARVYIVQQSGIGNMTAGVIFVNDLSHIATAGLTTSIFTGPPGSETEFINNAAGGVELDSSLSGNHRWRWDDGKAAWFDDTPAVSLAGTCAISSQGGVLEQSCHGSAWAPFGSGSGTVTAVSATNPLFITGGASPTPNVVGHGLIVSGDTATAGVNLGALIPNTNLVSCATSGGICTPTPVAQSTFQPAGSYITALSHDVTAAGPGSASAKVTGITDGSSVDWQVSGAFANGKALGFVAGALQAVSFQAPLVACTDYVSLSCVTAPTDLGGTNLHPTVIAIEETGGPTRLPIAAIPANTCLERNGSNQIVGVACGSADGGTSVTVTGVSPIRVDAGAVGIKGGIVSGSNSTTAAQDLSALGPGVLQQVIDGGVAVLSVAPSTTLEAPLRLDAGVLGVVGAIVSGSSTTTQINLGTSVSNAILACSTASSTCTPTGVTVSGGLAYNVGTAALTDASFSCPAGQWVNATTTSGPSCAAPTVACAGLPALTGADGIASAGGTCTVTNSNKGKVLVNSSDVSSPDYLAAKIVSANATLSRTAISGNSLFSLDVIAIRESAGPTTLTIDQIPDSYYLVRSGSFVEADTPTIASWPFFFNINVGAGAGTQWLTATGSTTAQLEFPVALGIGGGVTHIGHGFMLEANIISNTITGVADGWCLIVTKNGTEEGTGVCSTTSGQVGQFHDLETLAMAAGDNLGVKLKFTGTISAIVVQAGITLRAF